MISVRVQPYSFINADISISSHIISRSPSADCACRCFCDTPVCRIDIHIRNYNSNKIEHVVSMLNTETVVHMRVTYLGGRR